jgi:hypothetical protein
MLKDHPIFRLAMQYMFWKTNKYQIDLSDLKIPSVNRPFSRNNQEEGERMMWNVIEYGETQCSEEQRIVMLEQVGKLLEVDYHEIDRNRLFHVMTPGEIQAMVQHGIDIQLHTHRHQFPVDQKLVHREIADNRAILEPLVGKSLHHFCYPSGIWSEDHWPFLKAEEIWSATTCDPGLNDRKTPRLALNRFLDGENISQIDFEAEMSGYKEVLRRTKLFCRW